MFGVQQIILKLERNEPLTQYERFYFVNKKYAGIEVLKYLSKRFENLTIEVLGDYNGNIMDLMKDGHLEGWCWQTTETSILFLNDDDYIERGNLKFEENELYYHSWICFKYKNKEYVFDPCLDFLCKKDVYSKIFETEVIGRVNAKKVKEYFINYITNPPKENMDEETRQIHDRIHQMLLQTFGEELLEKQKDIIVVHDKEDVNAPMYRNGVGYKTEMDNGKIKKLVAHYYLNG